jgi:hypothetical protein
MQVGRQDSVTHLVPASVVAIELSSVGSTLTGKGVRGRGKLKREDTFPFNDRTVLVIRSRLDGLSLDDMMMISNQESPTSIHEFTLPTLGPSSIFDPTDAYLSRWSQNIEY